MVKIFRRTFITTWLEMSTPFQNIQLLINIMMFVKNIYIRLQLYLTCVTVFLRNQHCHANMILSKMKSFTILRRSVFTIYNLQLYPYLIQSVNVSYGKLGEQKDFSISLLDPSPPTDQNLQL